MTKCYQTFDNLLNIVFADPLINATEEAAVVDAHNQFRATVANGSAVNSEGKNLPSGQNIYRVVSLL